MNSTKYIGNAAYCYSNSTAMLLSSIDENISTADIEAISGVAVGAFQLPGKRIVYFSNYGGLPDQGISRALRILGFKFVEKVWRKDDKMPYDELRELLKTSPVLLGPLDMGYLVYNPSHKYLHGVDHFVVALSADEKNVILHDPAGFANVFLDKENLDKAWRAEAISYKSGLYRLWTQLRRVSKPSKDEIYEATIKEYIDVYKTGEKYANKKGVRYDEAAIQAFIEYLTEQNLQENESIILGNFVFPVGARRMHDISEFLKERYPELSEIKAKESEILGKCVAYLAQKDYKNMIQELRDYSELDKQFKAKVLSLEM